MSASVERPGDFYKRKKVPRVTVDAWIVDGRGRLLLVRRGRPPFQGSWGLPGGFLEWNERTEACCARETLEETGLEVRVGKLLGVYSAAGRDPRGHNVTVLYAATPVSGRAKGGDDADEARWFTKRQLERLDYAFDHAGIVREQMARQPRAARRRGKGPARRARTGAARG